MTTTAGTESVRRPAPRGSVERIVLLAGGDLAAYAAARWVGRRAAQHPVAVTLVATEREDVDGGRLDRTAEAVRNAAPDVPLDLLEPVDDLAHDVPIAAAEADLLVLGTNRVTAVRRRLPPSASVRLAEAVRCPAVLVPSDWQPTLLPVVAGVALDRGDAAALRFAVAEAESLDRELVLQHTWHLSDVVTPVFAFALDESPIRAEHAERLEDVAGQLRREYPSLRLSTELVHGEARAVLPQRGGTAELVVIGSHGRSSVDRVLLGSVGRSLAERPPCPVAIVPPRYGRGGPGKDTR